MGEREGGRGRAEKGVKEVQHYKAGTVNVCVIQDTLTASFVSLVASSDSGQLSLQSGSHRSLQPLSPPAGLLQHPVSLPDLLQLLLHLQREGQV